VAEGARLESVFTRKGNGGSNPSLSAIPFSFNELGAIRTAKPMPGAVCDAIQRCPHSRSSAAPAQAVLPQRTSRVDRELARSRRPSAANAISNFPEADLWVASILDICSRFFSAASLLKCTMSSLVSRNRWHRDPIPGMDMV
jgi:hypothetical protein